MQPTECAQCGAPNPLDSKFCDECGASLEALADALYDPAGTESASAETRVTLEESPAERQAAGEGLSEPAPQASPEHLELAAEHRQPVIVSEPAPEASPDYQARGLEPVQDRPRGVPARPDTGFYSSDAVQITATQAVIEGRAIPLDEVMSVSMHSMPARRGGGILIAVVGAAVFFGALFSGEAWGLVLAFCLGGLAALGLGITLAVIEKQQYAVRVYGSFGVRDALVSPDLEYVEQVVRAMNEALGDKD